MGGWGGGVGGGVVGDGGGGKGFGRIESAFVAPSNRDSFYSQNAFESIRRDR